MTSATNTALSGLIQVAALATGAPVCVRFLRGLRAPEVVQRRKLAALLKASAGTAAGRFLGLTPTDDYERFARRLPPTDYAFWAPWIDQQRRAPDQAILFARSTQPVRYEPTSGSTHARKWIPYPRAMLAEFNAAAAPWMADLARTYPASLRGAHYWSLSWMPSELRDQGLSADDTELLPRWKRALWRRVLAVPASVARLPTSAHARFATICHLSARDDLTLVSVWSPTFWLELMETLGEARAAIATTLHSGHWPEEGYDALPAPRSVRAARALESWDGSATPELFRTLWPRLALISCWTTAASAAFVPELAARFPQVSIQGKGLWATEGAVTIPVAGRTVLAIASHFYEFECLDSGEVLPCWALREGMQVRPLLSSSSGLFRYALDDCLRVSGTLGRCPTLEFVGRLRSVDLVGEKIDDPAAIDVLRQLSAETGMTCLALLAADHVLAREASGARPGYTVLAEPAFDSERLCSTQELGARADALLSRFHHYRLARELGQLAPAAALVRRDARAYLARIADPHGARLAGARKLEPLLRWNPALGIDG